MNFSQAIHFPECCYAQVEKYVENVEKFVECREK